jgi:hypothetical protein
MDVVAVQRMLDGRTLNPSSEDRMLGTVLLETVSDRVPFWLPSTQRDNAEGEKNRDQTRGHSSVLRLPRPLHKGLTGTLHPSPAQKLGQRVCRVLLPLAGQENECSKNRLRFLEADVDLVAKAASLPFSSAVGTPESLR